MHLVYEPEPNVEKENIEAGNLSADDTAFEQTNITEIQEDTTLVADNDETIGEISPDAESTMIGNGDTLSSNEEESTEADRGLKKKSKKKIRIIKKQAVTKLNKKVKNSCFSFVVDASDVRVGGRWVNVSD